MKKRIGISFTTTNLSYYVGWFGKQGLDNDVELIDLSFEKNNEADFDTCDGFILTGGVDIHPSLYSSTPDYEGAPSSFQPNRDRFEEKLFNYAQANNKPLLGICRGLQLVNVLLGGKLVQDHGLTANQTHKAEGETDKQHVITVMEGTLLHDITQSLTGNVNSAHHQAVDPNALGENLMVNALSANDHVIEGLEYSDKTNKPFMLCVQWHPERISDQQNAFTRSLLRSFLEAVRTLP